VERPDSQCGLVSQCRLDELQFTSEPSSPSAPRDWVDLLDARSATRSTCSQVEGPPAITRSEGAALPIEPAAALGLADTSAIGRHPSSGRATPEARTSAIRLLRIGPGPANGLSDAECMSLARATMRGSCSPRAWPTHAVAHWPLSLLRPFTSEAELLHSSRRVYLGSMVGCGAAVPMNAG